VKGVGYARHQSPPKEVISSAYPTHPNHTSSGSIRATVLKARLTKRPGALDRCDPCSEPANAQLSLACDGFRSTQAVPSLPSSSQMKSRPRSPGFCSRTFTTVTKTRLSSPLREARSDEFRMNSELALNYSSEVAAVDPLGSPPYRGKYGAWNSLERSPSSHAAPRIFMQHHNIRGLRYCARAGLLPVLRLYAGGAKQDPGYGLPRIYLLPRTRVNKG
jgi:hypothetical protein